MAKENMKGLIYPQKSNGENIVEEYLSQSAIPAGNRQPPKNENADATGDYTNVSDVMEK